MLMITTSDYYVRPKLRGLTHEGPRHRRALREPARTRPRAVYGREERDPGARPHLARVADEAWPGCDHDARRQAPWHDDAVRRARRDGGHGHQPVYAPPPRRRGHPYPATDR